MQGLLEEDPGTLELALSEGEIGPLQAEGHGILVLRSRGLSLEGVRQGGNVLRTAVELREALQGGIVVGDEGAVSLEVASLGRAVL